MGTFYGDYSINSLYIVHESADKLSTWSCLEIRMQEEVTV